MSPPLPGLWNPDASAPRDGAFCADLAHELGHGIAARHFGVHVASITLRGLAVLDGRVRVHGGCSTEWWARPDQSPWDLAVLSAAGPVAECLERDEDPLHDPLALMRSSAEFAGDLEDVLVAAGLQHGVAAADSLAHVETAVCEACDIVKARLPRMRSLIARYEDEAITSDSATLVIPWDNELDRYFSMASRDERPLTISWLLGALGR
jgi:hypothetical protein